MENSEVVQLYLDDIIPNRFQPREVFDDQALKELAISIREHGVIQPILVRKFGEKFEIIAGERRYKASTMAGLTKIPAIVKNLDDKESSKVALIENLQRRDLTPIEEARTYQKILDLDEMTQEALAKTMGKSQSAVSNKLRLLSLPDEIQEALLKEEISERHARSLLNVSDRNTQVELLKEIINNRMTVRELDLKIKKINGESTDSSTDTNVGGGSTNPMIVDNKGEAVDNVVESNTLPINLFAKSPSVETEKLFDNDDLLNNNSNSLNNISSSNDLDDKKNVNDSLFSSEIKGDNMNNESLFVSEPTIPFNVNSSVNDIEGNNASSLFNDPTTVDINKIREQSSDINPVVPEKTSPDMKSLLNPDGFKEEKEDSKFISISFDEPEKVEEAQGAIGSGLLAGMPVIKSVDNVTESKVEDSLLNSSSTIKNNDLNNNFNSLFSTPSIDTIKEDKPVDLFEGTNTQNAVNNESVISSNNIQTAVSDVRGVIKSYQEKGFSISIEELDLDREIQLIIKFNKN